MSLFSRNKTHEQSQSPLETAQQKNSAKNPSDERRSNLDEARAAAHLKTLGLAPGATAEEIATAYSRLVSDLTPGPGASHSNVALAEELLSEVEQAFAALRMQSVA